MVPKIKSKYYFLASLAIILSVALIIIKPGKTFIFQNEGLGFINHEIFDNLLYKYVDENGKVDYSGFQRDSALLNRYLVLLERNPPAEDQWTREQRLAYWINAYNAFTIKLITDHYPLKSIKDIGSSIQIPFINSPWDIAFISIGDNELTLNDIEHRILRKEFNEPRIHFSIVCASNSCPNLRTEAYMAQKLEEQLNEQAVSFINNPSKNRITMGQVRISRIFQWFAGDFKKKGTIIDYLNLYSRQKISPDASINYMDYDWGINDTEMNSQINLSH